AYLEDSDDIRNTPARPVVSLLKSRNAEVRIHDPYIEVLDDLPIEQDFWKAVDGSECLVFITKHSEYFNIDLEKTKDKMKVPIIIDGRNIFNRNQVEKIGFYYKAIGKG
ncbi:MAG: UDP binding domain-containing protein, partial [Candidatus Hodarchaeales archaeon]